MKKLSLIFLLSILFVLPGAVCYATAPITGFLIACVGTQTALHDATTGGLWSSTNPSVATVNLTSGVVTGMSIGTATISYNVSGIVATAVVSINTAPFAATVSGPSAVCANSGITLTDPLPGGVWSSSTVSVASVDGTGNVMGITGGTATISYTVSNSSCSISATQIVTVHPLPLAGVITGVGTVCSGATLPLSDAAIGGVWSSSATGVATVSPTGVVTGIATGTTTISYTLTSSFGCVSSTSAMVRVNPAAISGYTSICVGNITALTDAATGGTWASSNTTVAAVGSSSGVVNGISTGTVNITYTLAGGCYVTVPVLVQPALAAILGTPSICGNASFTLSDASAGGVWTSGDTAVAKVNLATGVVTGVASGDTYITYALNPGCIATVVVSINPIPPNFNVTGGGSYCAGGDGVPIGLNGSMTGITYQLFYGTTAGASLAGTDSALNYGIFAMPGDYTIVATNTSTGCFQSMAGVATVSITPTVAPDVTIITSTGTTICAGVTVLFTPSPTTGGSAPIYDWEVNGSPMGPGATFAYTPVDNDTITVRLKSSADCVSPDTASGYIVMNVTPILTPSSTVSASPGDSVCPGTPVTFDVTPVNGGTAPIYHWMKNGVLSATGASYTYMPVMGDNIYCEMMSSYACPAVDSSPSTNFISMNVPPIFVPDVLVIANPGNIIGPGEAVTFTAEVITLGGLIEGYQWEINSVPVPGATSDTFSSNALSHRDTVKCLVTGSSTCGLGQGSGQVVMIDTVALAGVTSVQYTMSDIRLLPNPNKGTFTVKGTLATQADKAIDITVTDMLGQVIYKDRVNADKGKLNAEIRLDGSIASGIYLLNVKSEKESKVFHFVIE